MYAEFVYVADANTLLMLMPKLWQPKSGNICVSGCDSNRRMFDNICGE